MDERALVLLRRKLEALNYTERLDAASAPLVSRLVDDLVRTTDSYRSAKLQSGKFAQEISTFNTKVRVARCTAACCAPPEVNTADMCASCHAAASKESAAANCTARSPLPARSAAS